MTSLAQRLSEIVGDVFEGQGLPRELGLVRVSDRPDLCQFQCNGAMAAARHAKKNPREVAQGLVEVLQRYCHCEGSESEKNLDPSAQALQDDKVGTQGLQGQIFDKVEIAGPGFINIDVSDDYAAGVLAEIAKDRHCGLSRAEGSPSVVLDYGGPNIAKAMHVGHLRSSIIGDCLRRLYDFAGYKAIGDVHMGDWGTPMGMILSELDLMGFDGEITMDLLAEIYPKASGDCKEDHARMELARAATKRLQDGDAREVKRWRAFIDVSIAGMKGNFDALGVHFDEWKGESDAHPFIEGMIDDLKAQGCAVEDQGALIVQVEQDGDKKDVPPLILLKSDGAVLYGTTDLATIIDRIQTHDPARIVYCVDQRQSLHFEQVFRAAKKGGIVSDDSPELIFAGFGTMNGTDGKPFKTRAGGVMRLEDLISMGLEKARARLDEANISSEIGDAEREEIARKVALAAIKFADLQNQRQSDYVFDLDRMTSFEGKTGPYLLYQAVRIQSLLRKAGDFEAAGNFKLGDDDRALALLLCEFADHFMLALNNHTPHVLCDYAYKLAQEFSSFYGRCHILSEEDAAVRASRLALCAGVHSQLVMILGLLGIEVPDRM